MEAPGGVEPPTCGLGNRRSIHLSYGASVHLIVANQVLVATAYNRRTSISKIETGQPSVFRLVWRIHLYQHARGNLPAWLCFQIFRGLQLFSAGLGKARGGK